MSKPTGPQVRIAAPESEQALLGAILLDPAGAAETFDLLEPTDFEDGRHQAIYESCRSLYGRGQEIDFTTVGDDLESRGRLSGGITREYLYGLPALVPTSANIRRYARIVREHSLRRKLARTGASLVALSTTPSPDGGVKELLTTAETLVFGLRRHEEAREGAWLADEIPAATARIEAARDPAARHPGIETGFADLDDMLGGLQGGQLVVVAGRPAMGKTAFALNVAAHAALHRDRPARVALFSLEMSRSEVLHRLIAAEAGVSGHVLRRGHASEDALVRAREAATRLRAARVWIDDSPTQGPFSIRSRAMRVAHEGLNLVIVDYLQLMSAEGQESRVQEVSLISRSLKALARELNVPVIAVSQLNRMAEGLGRGGHRPRLCDLRESGSIEQDSDVVILLYREDYYNPTEQNKGVAEAIVAKQRNGPVGVVTLAFSAELARFRSAAWQR